MNVTAAARSIFAICFCCAILLVVCLSIDLSFIFVFMLFNTNQEHVAQIYQNIQHPNKHRSKMASLYVYCIQYTIYCVWAWHYLYSHFHCTLPFRFVTVKWCVSCFVIYLDGVDSIKWNEYVSHFHCRKRMRILAAFCDKNFCTHTQRKTEN